MHFWYIRFALEWTVWLILADKKRWRELFPVGFMAGLYGDTTDILSPYCSLWKYDGNVSPIPQLINTLVLINSGIGSIITYSRRDALLFRKQNTL